MNLILVMYHLEIGNEKFLKQISVQRVSLKGEHLKACNFSFIVAEVEQDLDAYAERNYEAGASCESVRAVINEGCHEESDYEEIKKSLITAGWRKARGSN